MLDGELETRADGDQVVRFERLFDVPPARVWAALTDPKVLKNWFGEIEIDPRVGGVFIVRFPPSTNMMSGQITAFEPERVLEYTWSETTYRVMARVRWELSPTSGGCRLVLMHTFPPEAARGNLVGYLGGWHDMLDHIPDALAGRSNTSAASKWKDLDEGYRLKVTGSAAPAERGQFGRVANVRFERLLPGPIDRVWAHLTDPKLLPAWFGDESRIDPGLGGEVRLMGGHIRGVVTQWEPPERLTYTWNVYGPDDGPDARSAYPESYLTFTLETFVDQVMLSLTHFPVLERFQGQNAMGWHTFLDILEAGLRDQPIKERSVYMQKNAALYGVDLANLTR